MKFALQLDGGWISAGLDQDADYPNPDGPPMGLVFMNRKTGEFIEVPPDRDAAVDDSANERQAIESSPVSGCRVLPPSTVTQAARSLSLTRAVGNRFGPEHVIVPMLTSTNKDGD